jgi:dTDP-4-amino-4,6-dideoxygalactose transaminase
MLSNFADYAQQLEGLASRYLGVEARVVVNGDIGLTLAIAALQVPRGAACLVPSFTFSSTVNAVIWNGLRPVFVDIDPSTLNMDVSSASQMASEDVKLILATHVFGNPAETDGLQTLASTLGSRLVFDAWLRPLKEVSSRREIPNCWRDSCWHAATAFYETTTQKLSV